MRRQSLRATALQIVTAIGLAAVPSAPLLAAELVMFDQIGCEFCDQWDEEVGVAYPKTAEGKRAPLRRLSIHDDRPEDLAFIEGVRFTPTFVLVDNGAEVGRIEGYPGDMFFWGLLGRMIEDLPTETGS